MVFGDEHATGGEEAADAFHEVVRVGNMREDVAGDDGLRLPVDGHDLGGRVHGEELLDHVDAAFADLGGLVGRLNPDAAVLVTERCEEGSVVRADVYDQVAA